MKWVAVPADLNDEFHPNIRWVPLPRDARNVLGGYVEMLERILTDCPACEHSSHPTHDRLFELQTMPYGEYLRTPEWQQARRAKLNQVGNQCRRCGGERNLHVHHLTYDHLGHEWLDELAVLCRMCHQQTHWERDDQWRRHRRRR